MNDLASVTKALLLVLLSTLVIATAASPITIAKITITANNSTNVKPFLFFGIIILLSLYLNNIIP